MHAVVWRSPRAPSYFTTSCRRQRFHWTPRTHNPKAPKPDLPETSETSHLRDRDNQEDGTREEGDGPWHTVANGARQKNGHGNTIGGRLPRTGHKSNGNASTFAHSIDSKVNGGLPPVDVPKWFLDTNVRLNEESDSPNLEAVVQLKDPATGRLVANLPSYQQVYHEFYRRFVNRKDGVENDSLPSAQKNLPLSSVVMTEIAACISAGLSIPLLSNAQSFPAAKSNLILHCPFDGFDGPLRTVVHVLAQQMAADVVSIDAQDLSEIVGDYLSEPQRPESRDNSWRNLAYDVQDEASRLRKISEKAQDDASEEDEMQDMEDSETTSRKAFTLSNSKGFSGISFHPVSTASDLVKLTHSIKSMAPGPFGVSDDNGRSASYPLFARSSSPSAQQWEDLKLSTVLESLLDSNRTKRQTTGAAYPSRARSGEESSNGSPETKERVSIDIRAGSQPDQESRLIEEFFQSIKVKDGEPMYHVDSSQYKREEVASSQQSSWENHPLQRSANGAPLIVLIEDFKTLRTTINGTRVLQKLERLVRQKRSEGIPIMIVGVSSDEHHLPDKTDDAQSDVGQWQADMESSLYRTILVPFNVERSEEPDFPLPPVAEMEELTSKGSTDTDMQHIVANARSLSAMCKRVNADSTPSSLREFLVESMPLYGSSLDFNDAHRLSVVARGMQQDVSTREMHPMQFVAALALTLWSDKIKAAWLREEREHRSTLPEDTKSMDASPRYPRVSQSKMPVQSRVKSLEKIATHHEKRLLPGVIDSRNITTTFSSVHTSPRIKEALKTLTSLSLTRPDAFTYGVLASSKIPGLLLYGPPGTGKTLLAKAVARESGATMLEISGGDIYDMYVGEGEKNVKAMFSLARKLSPCVVFIDEADAIFRTRGGERSATSHREIINQFLREWDGMNDAKESVFIMVATNRPFDLDDAVLRRLPRRLLVDLPVQMDREAILGIHLRDETLDPDVDLDDLAKQTPLYSGSDLKNLCVAAALACVREENEQLQHHRQHAAIGRASTTPTQNQVVDLVSESSGGPEHSKTQESDGNGQIPQKRILRKRHFIKAMEEIGASISEDMSSLNAMKQFDEKYGDHQGRRGRKAWGFGIGEGIEGIEESARVRK